MAKRKRLSAANPVFMVQTPDEAAAGVFVSPALPIASVAGDASATAALQELSQTLEAARAAGHMILQLELDQLDLDHLVRDRVSVDEADMQTLMQSLKTRGQQIPIEVMEVSTGRYGLISGWRRCQALLRLLNETGDARFGTVLALLRHPDDIPGAYQAMVEENEIRVGLSYFERARIVVKSTDQGVFETQKRALQTLFASASRAKRSKIGSFIPIVRHLEGALKFPGALGERLGLTLSKALEQQEGLVARLQDVLRADPPETDKDEQALIEGVMRGNSALKGTLDKNTRQADRVESPAMRDVHMSLNEDGSVVLSGGDVTPAFHRALRRWLKATS